MAELWNAILGGAIAGMLLAVLVGPVFFALLQTSIEEGFLSGMLFALGIISSDATFFLIAFFGISQLGDSPMVNAVMGLIGGTFLILFGLKLFLKKKKEKEIKVEINRNSLMKSYFKGFLINALNPSVLLYWVGVVSAATAQYESDDRKIFAFFLTTMIMVFSTDTLKAYLAYRLKNVITPGFMKWLNRISGSLLMAAGVKLLWDAVQFYL